MQRLATYELRVRVADNECNVALSLQNPRSLHRSPLCPPRSDGHSRPATCCGVKPCRRGTADTTAPGMSVSSSIRARSSADQRRRPCAPLITSKRRTSLCGSSLWSSVDTKRSSTSDRHNARSPLTEEGEVGTSLTVGTGLRSGSSARTAVGGQRTASRFGRRPG